MPLTPVAKRNSTTAPHLWCVGGVDSELRIPFLLRLQDLGMAVTAVTSGPTAPFASVGLRTIGYRLDRYINPWADLATISGLARLGAAAPPDLVQTFDTKPGLYVPLAFWRRRGIPVVRTVNGLGALLSDGAPLAACLRLIYGSLQRMVAPLVAMNVFQNADDRDFFLARGFASPSRVRLIPGSGVDVEAFARRLPNPARRAEIRRGLGIGDGTLVTTVCRMTRQKGIDTLLAAARLLRPRCPDVTFLLIGPHDEPGPLAMKTGELEREAPYVRWLGVRDDIPELLGASDLFVLPTAYREGVPRVLLEAGVAGLAVVTTTMPGCVDTLESGRCGLLVAPGDARALAGAIERCVREPELRHRFSAALHARVVRKFHVEAIVRAYCNLYAQVLSDHPPLTKGLGAAA